MVEKNSLEREYVIPLRKEWRKVANYRRAGRAIKAIKFFIARHMKVPDRDISKVKLDKWLNQEIWFKGKKKPPAKIKVIAKKENEIVRVELAEMPEVWKFEKAKIEKRHKPAEKKITKKEEKKEEKNLEEKLSEEKKEKSEKTIAAAEVKTKLAEQQAKAQKHVTKIKEPQIQRKALKK